MNCVLTLPPFVRGKVLGLLKFVVNEIKIFKNFCEHNESDIVAKVQWWGEKLPLSVRPVKVQFLHSNENYQSINTFQHQVTYEIRTTLNLFKSYLKNCDILEVIITDEVKNLTIGSAFLHNLCQLLEENTKYFALPMVNHQGDIIGTVKIYINLFFDKKEFSPQQESNFNVPFQNDKFDGLDSSFIQGLRKCNIEDEIDINSLDKISLSSTSLNESPEKFDAKLSSEFLNKCFKKCHQTFSSNELRNINNKCSLQGSKDKTNESLILENHQTQQILPQVEMQNDFSKIITFNTPSDKNRILNKQPKKKSFVKSHCTKNKLKSPMFVSKTVSSTLNSNIFSKSLQPYSTNSNLKNKKIIFKPSIPEIKTNYDSFSYKSLSSEKNELKESSCLKSTNSNQIHTEHAFPFKCKKMAVTQNILNYLFGCDMNEKDEKKALTELIKMSPCQHFVKTINKLYTEPPGLSTVKSLNDELKFEHSNCLSNNYKNSENINYKNVNYLNFNFNDPVERKYYEKFFVNNNSSDGFQLAQMLNQPEKDINGSNRLCINEFQSPNPKCNQSLCFSEKSSEDGSIRKSENGKVFESIEDCCDRPKKLNELDKIIESLNNYEKKILTQEKSFDGIN